MEYRGEIETDGEKTQFLALTEEDCAMAEGDGGSARSTESDADFGPGYWHLTPAEITVSEDGIEQWICQVESPDLASEWHGYESYCPDRIWLN